jgi:hypothetical protein
MKNKFIKSTLALSTLLLMFSCSEDDANGKSTQTPSAPSLTVAVDFNENQSLIETNSIFDFTVNLTDAQVVDVIVNVSQTSGTATNGEDFAIPSTILIPAGATSAAGTIELFEDDLAEDTETAEITIALGNESNVNSTPQTVNFEILNVTEDDLLIDFTWLNKTNITDNLGESLDPRELADLKLLIVTPDIPFTTEIATIDDGNFVDGNNYEEFLFEASLPDGEYNLAADFSEIVDFNGVYTDLDLSLNFNQKGIINDQMITYGAGLNTGVVGNLCLTPIIAKIIKVGNSFTVEPVLQINNSLSETYLQDIGDGTWSGSVVPDANGFETASTITTSFDGTDLTIEGIAQSWITDPNYWEEVIVDSEPVIATIDPATGAFTVEYQYNCRATWNGSIQPDYYVTVDGFYFACTDTIEMNYSLYQGGSLISGGAAGVGTETITLD